MPTHNIKQLGFSGLRGLGTRFNFFQRWIGTQPENPTVSYCQPLGASPLNPTTDYKPDKLIKTKTQTGFQQFVSRNYWIFIVSTTGFAPIRTH